MAWRSASPPATVGCLSGCDYPQPRYRSISPDLAFARMSSLSPVTSLGDRQTQTSASSLLGPLWESELAMPRVRSISPVTTLQSCDQGCGYTLLPPPLPYLPTFAPSPARCRSSSPAHSLAASSLSAGIRAATCSPCGVARSCYPCSYQPRYTSYANSISAAPVTLIVPSASQPVIPLPPTSGVPDYKRAPTAATEPMMPPGNSPPSPSPPPRRLHPRSVAPVHHEARRCASGDAGTRLCREQQRWRRAEAERAERERAREEREDRHCTFHPRTSALAEYHRRHHARRIPIMDEYVEPPTPPLVEPPVSEPSQPRPRRAPRARVSSIPPALEPPVSPPASIPPRPPIPRGKGRNEVIPGDGNFKPGDANRSLKVDEERRPGRGGLDASTSYTQVGMELERSPCDKCGDPIDGTACVALGKRFHDRCFRCAKCDTPLADKFYPSDDGSQVVCPNCLTKRICGGCGVPIDKGGINAAGMAWHDDCFRCSQCHKLLEGPYKKKENRVFCPDCSAAA